ncbi:hypothetical protein ACQ7DA_10230 [Zafaria sp. J156]|uniref:hypothetical protein n=1 Tax=Zafaria sp. J156 TaxID=3116490 RepID=UPI002E76422A|nr:hypothetical protein [Zafaria sp. J156]MEE1621558.1 hypothetical protein [Zafaria sp. J156]
MTTSTLAPRPLTPSTALETPARPLRSVPRDGTTSVLAHALIGAGAALQDWGDVLTARRAARHAALRTPGRAARAAVLARHEEARRTAAARGHSGLLP